MDEEENNWDFEGTVSAGEVATSGNHGKLQEVQCICEVGRDAVPTLIVDVIEIVLDGIEAKRKDATMYSQQTDLGAELLEIPGARETMSVQTAAVEKRVKSLKTGSSEVQLVLEKMTDESSRTEARLQTKTSNAEE